MVGSRGVKQLKSIDATARQAATPDFEARAAARDLGIGRDVSGEPEAAMFPCFLFNPY